MLRPWASPPSGERWEKSKHLRETIVFGFAVARPDHKSGGKGASARAVMSAREMRRCCP